VTRDGWLWFATAAGPVAWFGDLLVSYVVAPGPHRGPDTSGLLAISGAALLLALAGALVAWRQLRASRSPDAAPRPRFLAEAGLAMSGLAIALVIATALRTLILLPGGEP
jgi:hypothetical protein